MRTLRYRTRWILPFIMMFLLSLPAIAQNTADICGLEPRFSAGDTVTVTPGPPNNVRDMPLTVGERIGQINAGDTVQIINGPVCGDGFTWWQIISGDIIGWTAASNQSEYFLTTLSGDTLETIPFEFNGFEMALPLSVAGGVQGAFVNAGNPVEGTANASPATRYPPYVEFTFENYADTGTMEGDTPFIRVYTVESFEPLETQAGIQARDTINTLSNIFNSGSPDLPMPDVYQPGNIPDFSPGVAQAMIAQIEYIEFQDGRGIRFLTGYTQGAPLVNNTTLVYRYQGITADGAYFIDAHFPVNAPQNPPEPPENPDDPFAVPEGYADTLRSFYNDYLPADYTPSLSALDALLESFTIPQPPSRG